ncbi:MAG: DUF4430 domain-containing protein [Clostridia bacterium]|nr:DUF4430 domain-containing protein [Clostridia bacterium]
MKLFKKTLSVLLTALLLAACAVPAFAEGTVAVSLRVEGLTECLYYDNVTVAENATVYDVLLAADEASDKLTFVFSDSDYGAYLTTVNGLEAGTKTELHYDGWQYHVNDADPGVGITACTVSADDRIVLFYGDEWGETGMLYPTVDMSKIKEGKIFFTAESTTYDENWTPTVTTVNVTGYTLIWDGKRITPDKDGVATVPVTKLGKGAHSVQIERIEKNGMPSVLRFAPDFTVETDLNLFARIQLLFTRLFASVKALFTR